MSVPGILRARELALRGKSGQIPEVELPCIEIADIEKANEDIPISFRDQVILGFVPGRPNTLLTMFNPSRIDWDFAYCDIDEWGSAVLSALVKPEEPGPASQACIYTLFMLTIDPKTLKVCNFIRLTNALVESYKILQGSSTVVLPGRASSGTLEIFQVQGSYDIDLGENVVEFLHLSSTSDTDWTTRKLVVSTQQEGKADVCMANHEHFAAALLQTRCVFFFVADKDKLSEPRTRYWTDHGGDGLCAEIFEFDEFVFEIKNQKGHLLERGKESIWQTAVVYDTRPRQELEQRLARVIEQQGRGTHAFSVGGDNDENDKRTRMWSETTSTSMDLPPGQFFLFSVLLGNCRSIYCFAVFISPSMATTSCGSVLVLEAQSFTSKTYIQAHEADFMCKQAIIKAFDAEQKHDCPTTCGQSKTSDRIMTRYARSMKSVDLIKGDYWNLGCQQWS